MPYRTIPNTPPAELSSEAARALAPPGWMPSVPAETRGRIRSGMRWTVWLSVLAAPFSYGSTVLLVRTSQEAIGAFGLLTVYISLVSCVLYLGGDAVAFKFLPEMEPSERLSFLFSYFVVICASLAPWLALAALFPRGLRYIFGPSAVPDFLLFVLCLAPLPILFSLVRATLKANLDFRRPQLLARMTTVGLFLVCAIFFVFQRGMLASRPVEIIWSVYLGLTALAAVAGLLWLRKDAFIRDTRQSLRLRFWLPRGFWAYALGIQQNSLLNFFLQRLDYILVLNFGGMKLFGEYVAITTLAFYIPLINGYFYDTLLPSLTTLLAAGNEEGAAQAFRAHFRLFLLIIAAATCGLIFLAAPLLAVFGPAYKSLIPAVVALSALVGLACPGLTGGTILSAIGKPHRSIWVGLVQLATFVGLFLALWPRFILLGAAMALGISTLVGNCLVFAIGMASARFLRGAGWDYTRFGIVIAVAGALVWRWPVRTWELGVIAWALAVAVFLVVGRYSPADCRDLWRWIVPGSGKSSGNPARSAPDADLF